MSAGEASGLGMGLDYLMGTRALLYEAHGQAEQALAVLRNAWDVAAPYRYVFTWRSMGPDLVRLAVAAGDKERAREVTEECELGAERGDVPTAHGAALRCRGLFEDDPETLLRSVDAYRRGPRPLDLAFACEDAGRALGRSGRTDEGVSLVREATETYERVGAARDVARADAALRELGVRRGGRGVRARPKTGWESLTKSELSVVRLVAEGLTNTEVGHRLFISPRTVQTHLSHVFSKLGLYTRVELATEAARRGT